MIRNSEGFTLIEVLVTLFILTIGLLGMGALTVTIIQDNNKSREFTVATTLAQEKLEEIKRIGVTLPSSDQTENYGDISGYSKFKRVTEIDSDTPANASTVAVTVYWDSDAHSVKLQTIIAE